MTPLPCGCYEGEACGECAPWGDDATVAAQEALYDARQPVGVTS